MINLLKDLRLGLLIGMPVMAFWGGVLFMGGRPWFLAVTLLLYAGLIATFFVCSGRN